MRGQILEASAAGGGLILGSDGARYTFSASDWRSPAPPTAGLEVDFVAAGTAAQEIYALPGASAWAGRPPRGAAAADEGSSVTLGVIGIGCLVLGFVVPVLPTIAAFILGLIGADSAKRHNNENGLLLSRIAWIGALILFLIGIFLLVFAASFAWPFIGVMMEYLQHAMRNEMGQRAVLLL